jgi:hypothetical protein
MVVGFDLNGSGFGSAMGLGLQWVSALMVGFWLPKQVGVGQLGILGSRGWLSAWINWEFWVAVGCDWSVVGGWLPLVLM